MREHGRMLILLAALTGAASCAFPRHVPQPLLERDGRMVSSAGGQAAADVEACRNETERAAPVTIQPRWLPPLAVAANGVVIGTVETPHRVRPPRDIARRAMEDCLSARGYDVRGWE